MTTIKATGRMTKDLVVPFRIGDQVRSLIREEQRAGLIRVGSRGVIAKIEPADPDDGDETVAMFTVRLKSGRRVVLSADEFELRRAAR
jgi:hypothetical protein